MSKHRIGEYIEIEWGRAEPPFEALHGHMASFDAIRAAAKETECAPSVFGEVRYAYARHSMEPNPSGNSHVFRTYGRPERGRFPVTLIYYKKEKTQ